ncbi:MAG: hypothetical protein ACOYD0_12780, partial [Candidatus Nanopelagicales bacterium]
MSTGVGAPASNAAASAVPTSATASDTFTRKVANGWGSADLGGSYATGKSTAGFSTDGGRGVLSIPTAYTKMATLPSVEGGDVDAVASFALATLPSVGGGVSVGPVLRSSSGKGYYLARLRVTTSTASVTANTVTVRKLLAKAHRQLAKGRTIKHKKRVSKRTRRAAQRRIVAAKRTIAQQTRTLRSLESRAAAVQARKAFLGLVYVDAANGVTTLANDVALPFAVTAGAKILMRTQTTGTRAAQIQSRAWLAGTKEPTSWQRSATGTQLSDVGQLGVWSYVSGSSKAATVYVDDLDVTSLKAPVPPTPTPTP